MRGVLGMSRLNLRSRSHGSSARKRVAASKVAPPQTSIEWKPTASISSARGSMSAMRSRVANRLWWASRKVVSVILTGLVVTFPVPTQSDVESGALQPQASTGPRPVTRGPSVHRRQPGGHPPRGVHGKRLIDFGNGLTVQVGLYGGHHGCDHLGVSLVGVSGRAIQRGMLPCFFGGRVSRLLASISRARTTLGLVSAGSITSSIIPRLAATYGFMSWSS